MHDTTTQVSLWENLTPIVAPGFPESRKGMRRTREYWQQEYPFLKDDLFEDSTYFREFRPVEHPHVEVSVMASMVLGVTCKLREALMRATHQLKEQETSAKDTTVAYANRLAQDALQNAVADLERSLLDPKTVEQELLRDWKKHFGIN
jgi:hypothetical protein